MRPANDQREIRSRVAERTEIVATFSDHSVALVPPYGNHDAIPSETIRHSLMRFMDAGGS